MFVENYERLEADKKKQVHKKRRFEGPTIRYHSVLMPLVSHSVLKEENVDVEGYVDLFGFRSNGRFSLQTSLYVVVVKTLVAPVSKWTTFGHSQL